MRPILASLAIAALLACSGCGGGERPQPPPPRPERFDPRPPLPDGWSRVVNASGGFSFGLPPGWRAVTRSGVTLVRSTDGGLSASLVADRSSAGSSRTGLEAYARRTLAALGGYRGLRVRAPRRQRGGRYPTVTVRASGTFTRTGVSQEILLAAIRRPGQVTFSLLFFRNAATDASAYDSAIRGVIRTFSAQPPRF